jgi:hypothetical protein
MKPSNSETPRPASARNTILTVSAGLAALFAVASISRCSERSSSSNPVFAPEPETATATVTSASTSIYRAAAQELVKQHLRDPSSAQFSDIRVIPAGGRKPTIVCGKVNARNGFGGMTGAQRFVVGGTVAVEEELGEADMNQLWATFC